MATNKAKAIYFALASALVLGSSQMQAQTDLEDPGYVAPPAVEVEVIEQELEAADEEAAVQVEEQEVQIAAEEADQESELALEQQEEEVAHDAEMSEEETRHDAEMRAYLLSKGLTPPK